MKEEEIKNCSDIEILKERLRAIQGQIELDHQDYRALEPSYGKERDLILDRLAELGVPCYLLGFHKVV